MSDPISDDLDRQIAMTHQRLTECVEARLPNLSLETKERYFTLLSLLVTKLTDVERPLRDVLREVAPEVAGIVFLELGQ